MKISESERVALAARIHARRLSKYGSKSAAYKAAGVNAATWDSLEDGTKTVREDRLIAAVKALWPSSGGDWRKIPLVDPAEGEGEPARGAQVEQLVRDLEDRIEGLERVVHQLRAVTGEGDYRYANSAERSDLDEAIARNSPHIHEDPADTSHVIGE